MQVRGQALPTLELQTSGSSGEPKRVVHTRLSMMAQGLLGAEALGLVASDEWLAPVPVTHAAGVGAFLRAFAAGAGTTLIPEFDLDWVMSRLSAADATNPSSPSTSVVSLVPTTLQRLLEAGLRQPTGLKAAVIGGGPLSEGLKAQALDAGVPVRASWGMTETLGMISVARSDDDKGVGRPLPGVEVRSSEEGQLLVRGPIVAPGLADPDGWFHTGDAGHVDEEGFVHVVGRTGSMIITGGENVFPEAIEKALLATGLVLDSLVTGEADSEWGERVVAVVVSSSDEVTPAAIRDAVRGNLAPWEIPKNFRFVDSINRTELGKLNRGSDD
jgi:O-succinylbenzoic acid--CoA ligase